MCLKFYLGPCAYFFQSCVPLRDWIDLISNTKHGPEVDFSLCESGSMTVTSNCQSLHSDLLEIRSKET